MLKGIVIGNIVSTRKQESLVGSKFLEVKIIENGKDTDKYIIAVDSVGAGIGETEKESAFSISWDRKHWQKRWSEPLRKKGWNR